jgi:hypothetical protein
VADRDYGAAVWNDTRDAGVCDDVNAYRQALHDFVVEGGEPAEPEEPRGVEEFEGEPEQSEDTPTAPDIQLDCRTRSATPISSAVPTLTRPHNRGFAYTAGGRP